MKMFSGKLSGRVHAGFTLIELLVVLAIIALPAA
jgi:prepilin-type N-terminal cleavage/methylation domain-containing protein